MISTDVLIVGGGPAGLAAALALRQQGAGVTVLDAQRPPIDKACGEGLMPNARRALAQLGVPLDAGEGSLLRGLRFAHHQHHALTDVASAAFPSTESGIGLRRQSLHAHLVHAAREAGISLLWNTPAQLLPGQRILVNGAPVRYRWLIGADGQNSRVRRWSGLEAGITLSRRFGFRRHYAVEPWSPYVEVHWAESGQAYVTPVSATEVCVAAITRDPHCRLNTLLQELPWLRHKLRAARPVEQPLDAERGAITTTRHLRSVARGCIALIGDASGSVDAITGEGMALAFHQAHLLAECLSTGNEHDDLERYNDLHPEILRLPRTMACALLLMDRFPKLRARALHLFAAEPALFTRLLQVHLGAESLSSFLLAQGGHFALRLAMPPSYASTSPVSFEEERA